MEQKPRTLKQPFVAPLQGRSCALSETYMVEGVRAEFKDAEHELEDRYSVRDEHHPERGQDHEEGTGDGKQAIASSSGDRSVTMNGMVEQHECQD